MNGALAGHDEWPTKARTRKSRRNSDTAGGLAMLTWSITLRWKMKKAKVSITLALFITL
ncbi:hypothetical protein RHEph01_gp003 [Rhizobium phage RHEph01]|uniref:Uncharacterized protein n=1 Tax=Rhizobium phage RHEph01 TaxID=1220601 RepID=L7TMK4_9CAUD|nr:hypothetical protein HOQ88_gp03 [Rhizobium phage RHEph01]AGC35514.1 hypothetical protein RHEph01_gp003 [Rhizobium phage RHEph01]